MKLRALLSYQKLAFSLDLTSLYGTHQRHNVPILPNLHIPNSLQIVKVPVKQQSQKVYLKYLSCVEYFTQDP